jgi:hypothetical protein
MITNKIQGENQPENQDHSHSILEMIIDKIQSENQPKNLDISHWILEMITDKIQGENRLENLDILTQFLRTAQHWNRQYTLKTSWSLLVLPKKKKKKNVIHNLMHLTH